MLQYRKPVARLATALGLIAATFTTASLNAQTEKSPYRVEATGGVVVSVSDPASRVGVQVLRQGGNAVDAAVATAFALAVTFPEAGNIGGGGFMLVHPGPDKQPVCIDYRETAPATARRGMFIQDSDHLNRKVVGTPGTVRGLALAHRKFGSRPWRELVLPAVILAEDGFVVDEMVARGLNEVLTDARADSTGRFAELVRVYGKPDASPWKAGDRLSLPDLGRTLRRIAEKGPDEFYTGRTAKLMVAEMRRGEGLVTAKDLAAYRAETRRPTHGTFRGWDIYGAPPPSSGGVCLVEMLNILKRFPLKKHGRWSPETSHLVIEAMRRAYRDRAAYLGDPAFVKIPEKLTSQEYARDLAASIDPKRATPSAELAGSIELAPESENTTHFSIADASGMAVANTYTLEYSFGSRIVVAGAGFLLNNEMNDFNWRPGVTNRQGQIGTPANDVAPGKRMLSSQSPTIVARDGRAVLVTGSPGGRTIINTVLSVVLGVLEFDEDLETAVAAPRLHNQWFPDRTRFEGVRDPKYAELVVRLRAMGHEIDPKSPVQGDAHSIWIEGGKLIGVADRRRSGAASGFSPGEKPDGKPGVQAPR